MPAGAGDQRLWIVVCAGEYLVLVQTRRSARLRLAVMDLSWPFIRQRWMRRWGPLKMCCSVGNQGEMAM
jgi:hypothetical protein